MTLTQKIQYNKKSAQKNNWSPTWFGCDTFDKKLIDNVIAFQKSFDLVADGLVGPMTYRRIFADRELANPEQKYLFFCGEKIPIDWSRVVTWQDDPYWSYPKHCYRKVTQRRKIDLFINHWDVALTSRSCHKILKRRNLSAHLYISEEGHIIQTCDLNWICYHAGNVNARSIGVEVNNAYYPDKYQKYYVKNGFGARPIITNAIVHGKKLPPFMGFYEVQLKALRAVWSCVSKYCDIPLKGPDTTTVYQPAIDGNWRGICSHFHVSRHKIDVAGLDINQQISLI